MERGGGWYEGILGKSHRYWLISNGHARWQLPTWCITRHGVHGHGTQTLATSRDPSLEASQSSLFHPAYDSTNYQHNKHDSIECNHSQHGGDKFAYRLYRFGNVVRNKEGRRVGSFIETLVGDVMLRGTTSDLVEIGRGVIGIDERKKTHIGRTGNTLVVEVTEIVYSINGAKKVVTDEPVTTRAVNMM